MRKLFMRKLLMAMGITLLACLLFYPLLLPTENYFRLLLQLLPVAVITGLLLLIPLYFICDLFFLTLKDVAADRALHTLYGYLRPAFRAFLRWCFT